MESNPLFGVILHAIGGLAAASFYIPLKRVQGWAWETCWLVLGVVAWLITPWVIASQQVPQLVNVLQTAPSKAVLLCYLFGALWGVGGLMYGMTMRFLGISLGTALALGFCAAFGTLVPPIAGGKFLGLLSTQSGLATLAGVALCLAGIGICGFAGMRKESELSDEQKQEIVAEFSFGKGVVVAILAGIMSACMFFAFRAGEPIANIAANLGTAGIWCNLPVLIVAFAGGLTTNLIWCVYLNVRNGSAKDYLSNTKGSQSANYLWCALGGFTWYLQFMFYSMGETQLGEEYKFSSWTLHMAFIIIFGTLWGLWLREWKGVKSATTTLVWTGIAVLVLSTVVVGIGNYLAIPPTS